MEISRSWPSCIVTSQPRRSQNTPARSLDIYLRYASDPPVALPVRTAADPSTVLIAEMQARFRDKALAAEAHRKNRIGLANLSSKVSRTDGRSFAQGLLIVAAGRRTLSPANLRAACGRADAL